MEKLTFTLKAQNENFFKMWTKWSTFKLWWTTKPIKFDLDLFGRVNDEKGICLSCFLLFCNI